MPSFGEKLKLEREKRKITLEQISASTKIGTRMLQALEEDKFNQLPGGIFNKGFVRAYSRVVGLDEDQTVADYLQASGDAPPVSTEIAPREPGGREDEAREDAERNSRLETISDTPPRQLPWGVFAAVLLVVALALSVWSHRQREHARESVRPAPTTATAQEPAAQSSTGAAAPATGEAAAGLSGENGGAGSTGSTAATAGSPTPNLPTSGSQSVGSSTRGSAPLVPPTPMPAGASSTRTSSVTPKTAQNSATQGSATAAPATTPGEFTVVIEAREESWISVTADGTATASEILAAGSARAVRGRKEIIVKVGNAGGIDFRFNGKKLDVGGEFGEVKTVTFGPQGILPNAPAPPSTP